MDQRDMAALEALIDAEGIDEVLSAMAVICSEKAAHVQSTWQDRVLAKLWEQRMALLDKLSRNRRMVETV